MSAHSSFTQALAAHPLARPAAQAQGAFDFGETPAAAGEMLRPGVWLARGRLRAAAPELLAAVAGVLALSPLRRMYTPGGRPMAVTMSNCGDFGWVTDRRGYRYTAEDPLRGAPWPTLPACLYAAAVSAAAAAGFAGFLPDACLINHYAPGAGMGLHQDRDEADFSQPIVSFSFGLPAVFLLGGDTRGARREKIRLEQGDVLVWGGPARLLFHGVAPVHPAPGPLLPAGLALGRLNLTFRRAAP